MHSFISFKKLHDFVDFLLFPDRACHTDALYRRVLLTHPLEQRGDTLEIVAHIKNYVMLGQSLRYPFEPTQLADLRYVRKKLLRRYWQTLVAANDFKDGLDYFRVDIIVIR